MFRSRLWAGSLCKQAVVRCCYVLSRELWAAEMQQCPQSCADAKLSPLQGRSRLAENHTDCPVPQGLQLTSCGFCIFMAFSVCFLNYILNAPNCIARVSRGHLSLPALCPQQKGDTRTWEFGAPGVCRGRMLGCSATKTLSLATPVVPAWGLQRP